MALPSCNLSRLLVAPSLRYLSADRTGLKPSRTEWNGHNAFVYSLKFDFLRFYNKLKLHILSSDEKMLGLSAGIKISISSKWTAPLNSQTSIWISVGLLFVNIPWGDMSIFSIQNGPLRYITSWQMTAKLYTSPFCVPSGGGSINRSSSGAVHSLPTSFTRQVYYQRQTADSRGVFNSSPVE